MTIISNAIHEAVLKNNLGFSLLEALMGVVILSGLIMVSLSVISQVGRMRMKSNQAQTVKEYFHNTLSSFENGPTCTEILKNANIHGQKIKELPAVSGFNELRTNERTIISLGNNTAKTNIKITALQLTRKTDYQPLEGNNVGYLILEMLYWPQWEGEEPSNKETHPKRQVLIRTELDAQGKIGSCLDSLADQKMELIRTACSNLGFFWNENLKGCFLESLGNYETVNGELLLMPHYHEPIRELTCKSLGYNYMGGVCEI